MLDRLGDVRRARVAHREAARLSAYRSRPPMHLAFDETVARFIPQLIGQRLERSRDESRIVGVAERERVGARQEPAENAVIARVVSRTFVVDTAAAEGVEHDPRTGEQPAPERSVEEE